MKNHHPSSGAWQPVHIQDWLPRALKSYVCHLQSLLASPVSQWGSQQGSLHVAAAQPATKLRFPLGWQQFEKEKKKKGRLPGENHVELNFPPPCPARQLLENKRVACGGELFQQATEMEIGSWRSELPSWKSSLPSTEDRGSPLAGCRRRGQIWTSEVSAAQKQFPFCTQTGAEFNRQLFCSLCLTTRETA